MAYDDDFTVARKTAQNLIAQLNADRAKKPSLTDEQWYRGMLDHFNALFTEGVFEPSFNPEDVFSAVSQVLGEYGLASLETILTDQEALGAWDSLPLVFEVAP